MSRGTRSIVTRAVQLWNSFAVWFKSMCEGHLPESELNGISMLMRSGFHWWDRFYSQQNSPAVLVSSQVTSVIHRSMFVHPSHVSQTLFFGVHLHRIDLGINGGTCTNLGNGLFSCLCPASFTGNHLRFIIHLREEDSPRFRCNL